MPKVFIEGEEFLNLKTSVNPLIAGEYEECSFRNCDFSDSDLSEMNFLNCEFQNCNFSNVNLYKVSFRDIKFNACKILGGRFEQCNQLMSGLYFDNCNISLSSFGKLKMRKTIFRNSRITESDFTETDLSESVFDTCDLAGSVFRHTNLSGVDLRTAISFSIDPERNIIKKARFSSNGIKGLLDKHDIEIEET